MNKIDSFFSRLDRRFDEKFGFLRAFFKKYFLVISTGFLGLIVFFFMIRIFYTRPYIVASIIEDDIRMISLALDKIDKECNILSVEDDHNEVDFLNIKSFSGSKVGPLSLAYPKRWRGPYLSMNPTVQDQSYEIVRARDGYYILPGQGVRLPNGLVIGKDFNVNKNVNVQNLLRDGGPLRYEEKKFAYKLTFVIGDWDPWLIKDNATQEVDKALEHFVDRMALTKNDYNP